MSAFILTSTDCGEKATSQIEYLIAASQMVAGFAANLPEDSRSDYWELLSAMGRSEEEMEGGAEAIREMASPLVGELTSMLPAPANRHPSVQKWSTWVGSKVWELRKLAGMTQEELAERAGLPQPHISRIERGEISPTRLTVEKIANALGRPLSEFDPSVS